MNPVICKKILALPEHFLSEQLQMIIDGKLKDGDRVLIECYGAPGSYGIERVNNHIILYPIEEKMMYTREEVRSFLRDAICAGLYITMDERDGWGEIDDEGFENWFEQNVK